MGWSARGISLLTAQTSAAPLLPCKPSHAKTFLSPKCRADRWEDTDPLQVQCISTELPPVKGFCGNGAWIRPTSAVPSTISVLLETLPRPIWTVWVSVRCSKGNLSFLFSQMLCEGRERADYHGEQVKERCHHPETRTSAEEEGCWWGCRTSGNKDKISVTTLTTLKERWVSASRRDIPDASPDNQHQDHSLEGFWTLYCLEEQNWRPSWQGNSILQALSATSAWPAPEV